MEPGGLSIPGRTVGQQAKNRAADVIQSRGFSRDRIHPLHRKGKTKMFVS
jgi:hypothetical protein